MHSAEELLRSSVVGPQAPPEVDDGERWHSDSDDGEHDGGDGLTNGEAQRDQQPSEYHRAQSEHASLSGQLALGVQRRASHPRTLPIAVLVAAHDTPQAGRSAAGPGWCQPLRPKSRAVLRYVGGRCTRATSEGPGADR